MSLADAFLCLDADGDGHATLTDLQRVVQWSDALSSLAPFPSIKIAFDQTDTNKDGRINQTEFTNSFVDRLVQLHPKISSTATYATAIVRASFSLLFEALGPTDGKIARSAASALLDAISNQAKSDGELKGTLRGIDIFGPPSPQLTHDEFIDAMQKVMSKGPSAGTVMRSMSSIGAAPSPSSTTTKQPPASSSLEIPSVRNRAKSMTANRSPLRDRHSAETADDDVASTGSGTTNDRGERVRLEARCRQLQAQVGDLQAEVERLRKAANLAGSSTPAERGGNNQGGGGTNFSQRALEAEVAALKDQLADAKSEKVSIQRSNERALMAMRDGKCAAEAELAHMKERLAVLEQFASRQNSWTSLFEDFKAGVDTLVDDSFHAARAHKAEEVEHRAAVAQCILGEAKRRLASVQDEQEKANRAMDSAQQRDSELSLREALLVVREGKFDSHQRKMEQSSLPERQRRLEMLVAVEKSTGQQMAALRREQEHLCRREFEMVAENEMLREQVRLLTATLSEFRASAEAQRRNDNSAQLASSPGRTFISAHDALSFDSRRSPSTNHVTISHGSVSALAQTHGDPSGARNEFSDSPSPARRFYW
jgi:hypothetical protein